MKIKLIPQLAVALLTLFNAAGVNAATFYVDNDISRPATHRTLQSAVDAAVNGDTIIIQPSSLPYAGTTILKRLTIRGGGFGGDATPNLLGSPPVANISSLTIGGTVTEVNRTSANGTIVEGLIVPSIQITSSNCIVRRCLIRGCVIRGPANLLEACLFPTSPSEVVLDIRDDIIINNNAVPVTGTQVRNCIFNWTVWCSYNQGNTDFHHCVFRQHSYANPVGMSIRMKNTRFYNCIFGGCTAANDAFTTRDVNPLVMSNCLFLDGTTVMQNGTGTITGIYSDTFLGQGQWGEDFRIKPGSPALTASTTGGEIGAFGGPTPFKVGGYPAVPRIVRTELISADAATGVRIKVKAESRD
jgi:hypothetical protein